MNIIRSGRRFIVAIALVLMLTVTTACTAAPTKVTSNNYPQSLDRSIDYGQLSRGDSAVGQDFGDWVVTTAKGLVKDAYVRDNNKLGVVISPQVRPNEVKALAQSLMQGFQQNFPRKDLSVLVYAPDKELILTAQYDARSKQVNYQVPNA